MRRAGLGVMAWGLAALVAATAVLAQAPPACSKAEFEAVVDEAAGALRALNQQNTPVFQAKLRQLKDKRGWSHDQFMSQAAPLVRDETIAALDQKSEDFLQRITSGGQVAGGKAPDCTLLAELRGTLKMLVETQKTKWAYMFEKIDQELRK